MQQDTLIYEAARGIHLTNQTFKYYVVLHMYMYVRKYKTTGIIKVNRTTVRGKYNYPTIKLPLRFDYLIGSTVTLTENSKEITLRIPKISAAKIENMQENEINPISDSKNQ